MRDLPSHPLSLINRKIEALCSDWLEPGHLTNTRRTDAVREICRQSTRDSGDSPKSAGAE